MDTIIAYYSLIEDSSPLFFMGGILCLDAFGKPLEFYCSTPVTPNDVQKILYGKSLRRHVGVELCGKQIAGKLKSKPSALFVDGEHLLDLRKELKYAVAHIRKTETASFEAEGEVSKKVIPISFGADSPTAFIQLQTHELFAEDREVTEDIIKMLLENQQDPSEPFERLRRAVDKLRVEDERFKRQKT